MNIESKDEKPAIPHTTKNTEHLSFPWPEGQKIQKSRDELSKKKRSGKKALLSDRRRVGSGGKGSHSLTFKTLREKSIEEQKQKPFER